MDKGLASLKESAAAREKQVEHTPQNIDDLVANMISLANVHPLFKNPILKLLARTLKRPSEPFKGPLTKQKTLPKPTSEKTPAGTVAQVMKPTEVGKGDDTPPPSKLIDDISNITFYHGTAEHIKGDLNPSTEGFLGRGIYITPDAEFAGSYTKTDSPKPVIKEGGNIRPVKVNIKNPLILETDSKTRHNANVMALEKLGVNRNKAEDIVDKAFEEKGNLTTQISSRAQKKGYDSIIFKVDGKIQELLVYNKKDVKSIFEKKHGGSVIERNPYNYKPKAI